MWGQEEAKPEKDYDNEVVYPEVHVDGKLAEKMGAAELKAGDKVKTCVVLRVKDMTKTDNNGKVRYSMTFCLEQMDDEMEDASDVDDDLEGEELPTTSAIHALSGDDAY